MGFGVPLGRWFRHELRELAHDTLLGQAARERGIMRPEYVRRLLDEHGAGMRNHQNRLWALLMLELWFRSWIDAAAEGVAPRPAASRPRLGCAPSCSFWSPRIAISGRTACHWRARRAMPVSTLSSRRGCR